MQHSSMQPLTSLDSPWISPGVADGCWSSASHPNRNQTPGCGCIQVTSPFSSAGFLVCGRSCNRSHLLEWESVFVFFFKCWLCTYQSSVSIKIGNTSHLCDLVSVITRVYLKWQCRSGGNSVGQFPFVQIWLSWCTWIHIRVWSPEQ